MKMSRAAQLAIIASTLVLVNLIGQCWGQDELQFGFYRGKCGNNNVEAIVRQKVVEKIRGDRTIVAALLRLQFHDCFINGCDASILLDGDDTEKTAGPNLSVRGYDFIDEIKTELENACQEVVSCADIIVMATRDAVSLSSVRGLGWYPVKTGRKDGFKPAENVTLPSPSESIPETAAAFAEKGLSATDMVYLIGGGHTVGLAHCPLFQDRLYNFQNSGNPDPTMNTALLSKLRNTCPQSPATNNAADLDQNPSSTNTVDTSFFNQILHGNGILQVDQELALDPMTKSTVATVAKGSEVDFYLRFGQAMINLGRLVNRQGEIRRSCRAANPSKSNGNFNLFG